MKQPGQSHRKDICCQGKFYDRLGTLDENSGPVLITARAKTGKSVNV
jgi:hypothetical protein